MAGIPGGIPFGSDMPPRGGEDVDKTRLYQVLEVDKDADMKEIKKAYKRLARIHHPDKGGDEHAFKELGAAYEILSDEDKRKAYDKYGLDGVSENGGRPTSASGDDLFSMFFGSRGRPGGPKKGPNINHTVQVSLEDLYNGKTKKMAINRKIIDGDVTECVKCNGKGSFSEAREIGPAMMTQVQRPCPDCNGNGSTAKMKKERKVVEVHIDPGMPNHKKITFKGLADEVPGAETGDVHFVIQEKPHELFHRKGADLLVDKDLSLNQALCGFTWKITHLDGHQVLIKTKPGQIIKCNMTDERSGQTLPYITMVKDEGMPSYGNPFFKGNLYIKFHLRFPEDNTFSPEDIEALKKILPEPDVPPPPTDDAMEVEGGAAAPPTVEEVTMDEADLYNFGKGGAATTGNDYYDSDEEGGRPVQCQQS